MAPQDDLTAERAAYIYAKLGRGSMPDIRTIGAAIKTARQEALREAASVVNDYNCRHDHGKKATKACDDIFDALERLASEGGVG